ncbi:MAG: MoaD/ThiS family protein, partial [Gammaproteobacteria bacterium]|nr:MoaD/ThiS family protein [Gammaproteobacteria bacterium]
MYFADLAEVLGITAERIDLPPDVRSVPTLLTWLRERGAPWDRLFVEDSVCVTVNKKFASPDTQLGDGDEIALIPERPVR